MITPLQLAAREVTKTFTGQQILEYWLPVYYETSAYKTELGEVTPDEVKILIKGKTTNYYAPDFDMSCFISNLFPDNKAAITSIEVGIDDATAESLVEASMGHENATLKDNKVFVNNLNSGSGVFPDRLDIHFDLNYPREDNSMTVTLRYVKVTYDTSQELDPQLSWSTSQISTPLTAQFSSPVLMSPLFSKNSRFRKVVTYTISNPEVATLSDGKVQLHNYGETTITAYVRGCLTTYTSDTATCVLRVEKNPADLLTATIHVATPGTLKDQMLDLPETPEKLIVTGQLNSADLQHLCSEQSSMASVTHLDMSGVTFDYDEGVYKTSTYYTGIGTGSYKVEYRLAKNYREETESRPDGLGGGTGVIRVFNSTLESAFNKNQTLNAVILPESLDSIGRSIFAKSNVSYVKLPPRICKLPKNAFAKNHSIIEIELPDALTEIEENAFDDSSIRRVAARNLRVVDEYAFYNSELETIDLSKVEKMGRNAFAQSLLKEASLPNLTYIPDYAFYYCPITRLELSKQLTHIGSYAFNNIFKYLDSIALPDGLQYIGSSAFYSYLTNKAITLNIPSTVTYIGREAVPQSWLKTQPTEGGVWYLGKVAYAFDGSQPVTSLTVKEGTVGLSAGFATNGDNSQALHHSLQKLSLPASLRVIGSVSENVMGAFEKMEALEEVTFGNGLEEIGCNSFHECAKLKKANLPGNLQKIGAKAFASCNLLFRVTLPETLTEMGGDAFDKCKGLAQVNLYAKRLRLTDMDAVNNARAFSAQTIEKVVIGPKVEVVPAYMFEQQQNLTKLVFEAPEALSPALKISDYVFNDCAQLKLDVLPERLTEVGSSAFSGGRLPADFSTGNLKIIGSRAFNISQVRSVTLEAALDSCGSDIFELGYKDTLQVLNYKVPNLRTTSGFDFNIAQVNIAANVEYLPMGLFNGVDCKVNFEPRTAMGNEKTTHLLIDEQCFAHNDSLTSLVLPDCRTAIGASAFQNCSKLTHLHLGKGTENIDALAFENCRNLKNIDLPPTLLALGYDAFYINTYSSSIRIHRRTPYRCSSTRPNRLR